MVRMEGVGNNGMLRRDERGDELEDKWEINGGRGEIGVLREGQRDRLITY